MTYICVYIIERVLLPENDKNLDAGYYALRKTTDTVERYPACWSTIGLERAPYGNIIYFLAVLEKGAVREISWEFLKVGAYKPT